MEPSAEELARRAELERERAAARARLAHAGASVYEGTLEARVAGRGLVLADIPRRPSVSHWLCDVLALDDFHGDSVRAHLSVELRDVPVIDASTPGGAVEAAEGRPDGADVQAAQAASHAMVAGVPSELLDVLSVLLAAPDATIAAAATWLAREHPELDGWPPAQWIDGGRDRARLLLVARRDAEGE